MQLSFVIFGVIENGFAEALAAEVLDKLFDGDMEAAKQCQNDYLSLLDVGDSNTEHGMHKWADVSSAMSLAVDEADYIVNENKYTGVEVIFWS